MTIHMILQGMRLGLTMKSDKQAGDFKLMNAKDLDWETGKVFVTDISNGLSHQADMQDFHFEDPEALLPAATFPPNDEDPLANALMLSWLCWELPGGVHVGTGKSHAAREAGINTEIPSLAVAL